MAGNHSRRKGWRFENATVHAFQDAGIAAWRCPLSGGGHSKYAPLNDASGFDVCIPMLGRNAKIELKCRANGFKGLYDWLENVDMVAIKSDRRDALVVMPMKLVIELINATEKKNEKNKNTIASKVRKEIYSGTK